MKTYKNALKLILLGSLVIMGEGLSNATQSEGKTSNSCSGNVTLEACEGIKKAQGTIGDITGESPL